MNAIKHTHKLASIVFVALFVFMLTLGGTAHAFAQALTIPQLLQQQATLTNQAQAKIQELQQINTQIQQLNAEIATLQSQIVPGKNYALLSPDDPANLPQRIEDLKAEIDQLSTNSQMDMVQLNSLNNQLSQTNTMINNLLNQQQQNNHNPGHVLR